jgi:hypothetical protein
MLFRCAVIIVSVYILAGCTEKVSTQSQMRVSDSLSYNAHARENNNAEIMRVAGTGVISKQRFLVDCTIKNISDDEIELLPEFSELYGVNETRSQAVTTHLIKKRIVPDDTASISLSFEPTSDLRLFQQTGLRGELGKKFRLALKFQSSDGTQQEISIDLITDSLSYTASVEQFGVIEATVPYQLVGVESKTGRMRKAGQSDSSEMYEGLRVTDNELLRLGFWTKFFSFYRNDSMHFHLRFVNQSVSEISINPARFRLTIDSVQYLPLTVQPPESFVLRNGGRGELRLAFPVEKAKVYLLSLDPITSSSNEISLTNLSAVFKQLNMPVTR